MSDSPPVIVPAAAPAAPVLAPAPVVAVPASAYAALAKNPMALLVAVVLGGGLGTGASSIFGLSANEVRVIVAEEMETALTAEDVQVIVDNALQRQAAHVQEIDQARAEVDALRSATLEKRVHALELKSP